MAVVKRYNTEREFFSERVLDKFQSIYENNLTIVEAPTGYGKTTAIRNVLKSAEEEVFWLTVENEDDEIFFEQICDLLLKLKVEGISEIRNIGCPKDSKTAKKIIDLFSNIELNDNYIIVFDNFQFLKNDFIKEVILKFTSAADSKIRLVIATQMVTYETAFDMILNHEINYIGMNDLEFGYDDIVGYFRECGIRLNEEEANYLLKYTEGWVSALYLQLLCYVENKSFEADTGINNLVCASIWEKLTLDEQDFLITMSVFESFSLKQAIFMAEDLLSSGEVKELLNSNSFIRYDSRERKYYIHAVLKGFLYSELEKIDLIDQKDVYKKAAQWFEKNEMYYRALKCYFKIGKYDDIYKMNISIDDLLRHIVKKNKSMFLKIISHCSYDCKSKNLRSGMVFCMLLFFYNEKDFFENECNVMEELIENTAYVINREKEHMLGEIKFLKSYLCYNDIEKLNDTMSEAYEYLKSPSNIFTRRIGITYRNPSVLGCYHSKRGRLEEEIEDFEDMIITYYKITQGDSNGADAVMRAEMLYHQGLFDDAQILCHKAIYMADTRDQVQTYICTMFLMARIAIFKGDYDNMKYILSSIRTKAGKRGQTEYLYMADLCEGFIYMMIDKKDSIPFWLKDSKTIGDKSSVFTLAFSNIIYAKYLICSEKYEEFIGISGAILGSIMIFNNILYEIYLYLYISVANYKLGNIAKATKFLTSAVAMAYKDDIYMPFVENYKYIEEISIVNHVKEADDFMVKVSQLYAAHHKEFKLVAEMYRNDSDYGLTNRELEIAKLAAKRFTNKEIADQLYIATETVKSNLKSIFVKLHIASRNDLKDFFAD